MEVTIDRIKHSLAVAKRMKELSQNDSEKYPVLPEEAFILGLLHDVGYEFVDNQMEHAQKGGIILKQQGYKYWKEVYYHGYVQNEYRSSMLDLLNYADITTDPIGDYTTIERRILDVKERYGENSLQAKEIIELANMISNDSC